jgi:hypothetical protein
LFGLRGDQAASKSFPGIEASIKVYLSFQGLQKNSTVFSLEKKLDLGKEASYSNS